LSSNKVFREVKEKIDFFQLDVIHITTDDLDMIEEMFLRLNDGVPVNNAERRNSIGGFLIDGVNELVKTSDFFSNKVKFGNRRMEHQDLVIKLSLIEDKNGNIEGFTKTNLDNLVKKYKPKKTSTEVVKEELKSEAYFLLNRVSKRLRNFSDIFYNNDEILKSKGIIPLYYIFLRNKDLKEKKHLRDFLIKFSEARLSNRKNNITGKTNSTLLRFDQLNQQGANQATSLEIRFKIMSFYYNDDIWDFSKEMPLSEIGLQNQNED
jgi:hypothetical protein